MPKRPRSFLASLVAFLRRKAPTKPALKPKRPQVAALASLPTDQAFAEARRLVLSGAV